MPVRISLFIFLVGVSVCVYGQGHGERCYDRYGKLTRKSESHYYRTGVMIVRKMSVTQDTVFTDSTRTYFTASGKLRSKEFREADGKLHGDYIEYFENGSIKERSSYNEGRLVSDNYGFYANGNSRYVLRYGAEEDTWYNSNRIILSYWDSLGNQLVKDGSGYCKCDFSSGAMWEMRHEEGQVTMGLRDGEWTFYRENKMVNKEIFDNGKFVSGIAYTINGEESYTKMEVQAEFKGGLEGLGKFLMQNLRYPKAARKRGAQGQSFVSFVVEKDGSVSDVKAVNELDQDLDIEACRVVRSTSGQWSTGKQRGHPVRSRFVLPIRFRL